MKELDIKSLDELNFNGPAVEMDLTEDAWSYGAPPPRGMYDLKCFLAKDGVHPIVEDEKNPNNTLFIRLDLECKIVNNPDWEDTTVFTSISTRVGKRKKISTAAGWLVKVGAAKYIKDTTPKGIAELVQKVLKKEPIVKVELDWRGAYDTGEVDKRTGKNIWENVWQHWDNFPNNDDGTKQHVVMYKDRKGGMHELRAQVQVTGWYAKGDEIPKYYTNEKAQGPQKVEKVQVSEPTGPVFATASAPMVVAANDEDINLMLE